MKHIIRILIIMVLTVSIAFSATFPKGIIAMKDGKELRVKKVSIQDNFVFYKYKGDKLSILLQDVEFVKVRGKIENIVGGIAGGSSLLLFGTIYSQLPSDMDPDGKSLYLTMGAAATAIAYVGGRVVGSIFDPWRKIYNPAPEANPGE